MLSDRWFLDGSSFLQIVQIFNWFHHFSLAVLHVVALSNYGFFFPLWSCLACLSVFGLGFMVWLNSLQCIGLCLTFFFIGVWFGNVGGKLVFQYTNKRASGPKCPVTGKRIQGVCKSVDFMAYFLDSYYWAPNAYIFVSCSFLISSLVFYVNSKRDPTIFWHIVLELKGFWNLNSHYMVQMNFFVYNSKIIGM